MIVRPDPRASDHHHRDRGDGESPASHRFLTQRQSPSLATIEATEPVDITTTASSVDDDDDDGGGGRGGGGVEGRGRRLSSGYRHRRSRTRITCTSTCIRRRSAPCRCDTAPGCGATSWMSRTSATRPRRSCRRSYAGTIRVSRTSGSCRSYPIMRRRGAWTRGTVHMPPGWDISGVCRTGA